MSKKYCYLKQIIFYLFLIAYILLMAKALLFKQVSPLELFDADRMLIRPLNLVPFETISRYANFNSWISLMNVAGNVILFIPLGLYLQIFKKNKNVLSCVALVFATSLCVEVIQYGLGLGSADIDDIFLNVIGGLLGIFAYKIIYLLLKDEGKTQTAITFLYCLACAGFCVWYFVITNFMGYRVRIF